MGRWRVLFAWLVACVAACGATHSEPEAVPDGREHPDADSGAAQALPLPTDAGDDATLCGPDQPPAPGPECARFAELFCTRLLDCRPTYPRSNDGVSRLTMAECLRRHTRCLPLGLPDTTFDAARLSACSERLQNASCALIRGELGGMRFCASPGLRRAGEPCEHWLQCASGSCDGEAGCADTAAPSYGLDRARDDGEAPIDGSCHNPFLSVVDGRCQIAGNALGEPCPCNVLEGLHCACDGNFFADTGGCDSAETCQPPPVLGEGEECGPHPKGLTNAIGVCADGLTCYVDFLSTPQCVPETREGEPCDGNRSDSTCAPDLDCIGPCGTGPNWRGQCVRPAE